MKRIFLSALIFIGFLFPLIGNATSEEDGVNALVMEGKSVPLTEADIANILYIHDRARCDLDVPAVKMLRMQWNNVLYTVAQNYANKCVFQHNANRSQEYQALGGKEKYVGENIYVTYGSKLGMRIPNAMNYFLNEKVNFSYMQPSACKKSGKICGCISGKTCGHYTQIIWSPASNPTVACAQADCTKTPLKGQLVVCDYAPGGNYISTEPYEASPVLVNTDACQAANSYMP